VPVPFIYNKVNAYSVGDPFITPDGKKLYFASNMPGSFGGTDIFYVEKTGEDAWGIPVNVKEINTPGNERTPYLDGNNNFYFSTDGRVGMGGLDIYQMVDENSGEHRIINMGYPVNSPQDDFAFNVNATTGLAYLSSNRTGGLGSDDIYNLDNKMVFAFKLTGKVYDKKTNLPVTNAIVTLSKQSGAPLKVETDKTGAFNFSLDKETDFILTGEKTNYRSDVANLTTRGLLGSSALKKDLFIEPVEIDKAIRLENIYYDFDKWNIRADAAVELDKLVAIMNDNPTIWIELGSHTDSRGKDAYNQMLSQKRAQTAIEYIISKGINKNRITAKGYGETQLLNKCGNGVSCSEEDHQLNRRTEFKITKQ
jgi:peptidoglycan-associated lipoprotein